MPARSSFNCCRREIVALADRERQHAVAAGALDQRRISVRREQRAGIAGGAPDHFAVAAAHDDVGEIGRKRRPLRHRQQMPLALGAGDFDQARRSSMHGRSAQQRPGDRDLVLARELADQAARRVGEHRQPLGQIGARSQFRCAERGRSGCRRTDRRDRAGARQPPRRNSSAIRRAASARRFGIAVSDDLVEPGDQRCRDCHQHYLNRAHRPAFGANLGAAW